MASRRNPTPSQQSRIISVASTLRAKSGFFPAGTLHPRLTEQQLAAEWASPGENGVDYLFADFINALAVTVFLLVPIFVLIYRFFPPINSWQRVFYSDLITIPSGALLVFLSFVVLRRYRRSDASRRLRSMDWERARSLAFARMDQMVVESPVPARSLSNTIREHGADYVDA